MSVLNKPYFHDEAAAFEYVEHTIWPGGMACPHCRSMKRHYPIKGVRTKASQKHPNGVERYGLFTCSDCGVQFTIRKGTIFEESHTPLHKWLQAIHLLCSAKKEISSHHLHRILEVTRRTATFMSRRIRGASPFDYEPRAAPNSPGEMGQPQVERFRTAACELKTRNSQAAFDAIVRRVAVQPFDTGTGRSIASGVARENGLTPHDKIDLIDRNRVCGPSAS